MSKIIFDTADAIVLGDRNVSVGADPVTVHAVGLAGVEEVEVFVTTDGNLSHQEYYENDSPRVLSVTDPLFTCYGPILLSFKKAATAGAVSIRVVRNYDL